MKNNETKQDQLQEDPQESQQDGEVKEDDDGDNSDAISTDPTMAHLCIWKHLHTDIACL